MLLKVPYVRSRKFVHNDNLRFKKTGFVPITHDILVYLRESGVTGPQDVIIYDIRQENLRDALIEGNRECGFDFIL